MKPISFIQPSRSNLKYLKWSYNSIRKNLGYRHELCWADDASTDGTWKWMVETAKNDSNIKLYRNKGPERLGHTILYDKLVELATNNIVMIFHADMYAPPGIDEEIYKHIDENTVVSLTRLEPPLHPPGPEKILLDYGIEPEEFDELAFIRKYDELKQNRTTEGIFAPWAIMKKDFQRINIPKLPVLTSEDGIKRIKEYFGKLINWRKLNDLLPDNFSLTDLALKWILMHDEVSVVIPGAKNKSEVQMNTHATDLEDISSLLPKINSIYDKLIKPDVHNRW